VVYEKGKIPDCSNVEELKSFFKDHEDYTTLEIALRYKIAPGSLRCWRVKAGLKSKTAHSEFLKSHKLQKKLIIEHVHDPLIWDNKEWFENAYSKYGIITISKIIGKTIRTVQKRLAKYEIKTKLWKDSIKSKNPYNNEAWIVEQYFTNKIGVAKMAKIAGVSIYTMYDWLVSKGIYPRSISRAGAIYRWRMLKIKKKLRLEKYNKVYGTSFQSFKEVADARSKDKEGKV
jgi:transposase-like protein